MQLWILWYYWTDGCPHPFFFFFLKTYCDSLQKVQWAWLFPLLSCGGILMWLIQPKVFSARGLFKCGWGGILRTNTLHKHNGRQTQWDVRCYPKVFSILNYILKGSVPGTSKILNWKSPPYMGQSWLNPLVGQYKTRECVRYSCPPTMLFAMAQQLFLYYLRIRAMAES